MTIGLTTTTGSTFSDNFSIAPQSMVAMSFDKKAIDKFYQGSLKATDKEIIVFNRGDGSLLSFAHEFGGGTGSKGPGLRFSLRIVDQDNYFLNSLFSSRYKDYISRVLDAPLDEIKEQAEEDLRDSSLGGASPGSAQAQVFNQFDLRQEVTTRLQEVVKTNTNFYITYGIGPNNRYWAGPFMCTLSNGIYEEKDGLVIFNLEFVGSKAIRTPPQVQGSNTQANSITSEEILFATIQWFDRTGRFTSSTLLNFFPVYKTVHDAVEPLILNYCKNVLGYSNVLLCYRDFGITGHKFKTVAETEVSRESVISLREFDALGIEATSKITTGRYEIEAAVVGRQTVRTERNDVVLAPTNDFIETEQIIASRESASEIRLKLDAAQSQGMNDPMGPVMSLLRNISNLSGIEELVDPVAVIENNVDIVKEIYDTYNGTLPDYITTPDEPVLIIGENFLIQNVIYGKPVGDQSKVANLMVGPRDTVVKKVYEGRKTLQPIIQRRKDRKPYVSIFDEEAPVVPEDFALPQDVSDKIRAFNIPVFRMNTQNANVLSLTANSDAFLISTIGQVSRQLMISATKNATASKEDLLHSKFNATGVINKITNYLTSAYNQSNVNNAYSVLSPSLVGVPNFDEMGGDLANLILAPDAALVGPNPLTTSNSSSSLIAYLYNFFRLFSLQHTAIIKTVPHFNFSDTELLGDNCIFFKNINKSLLGEEPVTNSIYTGVWLITGFKHVISGDDAYSEFSIIKKPFSMETTT